MSKIIDHVTIGDVPYGLLHCIAMSLGPSPGLSVYVNHHLHANRSVHGTSSPTVSAVAPAVHVDTIQISGLLVYTAPLLISKDHASGASPGLSKIVTIVASLSISAFTGLLNVT